jgi:hypothetical protein
MIAGIVLINLHFSMKVMFYTIILTNWNVAIDPIMCRIYTDINLINARIFVRSIGNGFTWLQKNT